MIRLSHYIFFLFPLMTLNACASSNYELTKEQFVNTFIATFHTQDPNPPVVNGTMQFQTNNQSILFIRNAQMTLQIAIQPLLEAGLETKDDIRIGKYILHNNSNNTLIIASNHIQTMEFQFFTEKEIVSHIYDKVEEEFSSLNLALINDYIYLSDNVLLFKFNENSYEVGIHHDVLTGAGVDLHYLPSYTKEGNYIIIGSSTT